VSLVSRSLRLVVPGLLLGLGLAIAFHRTGVRLWGSPAPALPSFILPLLILAVALLAPARPLRAAALLAWGTVLVLLAGSYRWTEQQVWELRLADHPLFGTMRPLDAPAGVEVALPLRLLWKRYRLAQILDRSGAYELSLEGPVVIPESGVFTLEVHCLEACGLALADHPLLEAPAHPRDEFALGAGVVPLRVWVNAKGRVFLRVEWVRPATLAVTSIEEAAGAGVSLETIRRIERAVLLSALLLAAVWVAAALVVLRLAGAAAPWRDRLFRLLRRRLQQPTLRRALVAGALATASVICLRVVASRGAPDGLHVHQWTGEYMMQVVSAADLKVEPLRSLFYLHIQPPALDALRALSVLRHRELDGEELLDAVDRDIYLAWALAAGLLTALVYVWLDSLVGRKAAALGTALLVLHPAFLFYATFLDSTFVSGAGVTWASYELWRLHRGPGSAGRLALSLSLLFLTRSVMQWPFLAVLALSLFLLRIDRRRALSAFLPFALVVGLFTLKQYTLFGLTVTSSFGPDSFCKGLSAYCQGTTPVDLPRLPSLAAASDLRRIRKLNGEYNWNQLAFLERSFSQMEEYKALLRKTPLKKLIGLVLHTSTFWLLPSSRHSPHLLVDALPWRSAYDFVFSGFRLLLLLAGATALFLLGEGSFWAKVRVGLGLALPVLYVVAVTTVFESGENMRYKFFVEPVLFVLIFTQAVRLLGRLRLRLRPPRASPS
jgi:hypothetical protein